MACAACGHVNREVARFCASCGAGIDTRCPACGTVMPPESRFCDVCGRAAMPPTSADVAVRPSAPTGGRLATRPPVTYTPQHLAERILTDGHALRGERKEVTVLFVDVQGSTELASALDPEQFHAVLDGAFAVMLDAVHRWEGTVNQFTGDGIMALFGAPIAHEDHARRACHAALEIRRAIIDYAARLRRERGVTVQVRLGLNSGSVVVGAIGDDLRMDYTAQGLTTNLAARMQQAADPGSVLAAAPTWRLAEGFFRFRPLGALRVRGVPEPIDAYVLEGEGTVVSRLEASLRRGASPFRGREAELRLLGEAWERASAGRGDAICLVGEPGIGKSRLAYELARNLEITERVEGMALAYARGTPYFVFRQLLRQRVGVSPDADLAAVRDALNRRLWDVASEVAPAAADLLSVMGTSCETLLHRPDRGADERRDRVREAVIAWFAAECRKAPCLVVVEDVQWLDPSSEEVCRHLAAAARGLPLLLLMTSRVPVAGTALEIAGVREIGLPALAPDDVHRLVDAQLEPYTATARLRRVIAARAEGNPFYVEEIVRALRDHGDLVLEGGAYDVVGTAHTAVPATIHALIAARVDRLPAAARELVADAAVLGKRFPLAHLRALAAPDDFDEALAQLHRRGLVDRDAGGPIATISFRHVLTQEVAYTTLLQADRQARHRRAAEMLESLYRGRLEEVCEQLAYHWLRSDRRAAALPHLLGAADGAVAVGANREAVGHLQTALALAAEYPETIAASRCDAIRLKLAGLYFVVEES